jgi:hypothetical protein
MAYVRQFRFGYTGEDEATRPQVTRFVSERRAEATARKQPVVQHQLARLLMIFPELKTEENEISRLLTEAAQRGHPTAQQFLGLCSLRLEQGCAGISRPDGLGLLAKAAQSGDPVSQFLMGLLALAEGPGAYEKAAPWLEAGTRSGHTHATKYLAAILATAPASSLRHPRRAQELIEPLTRAARLGSDPDVWQILAAALAGQGSFDPAAESQRRAVELASRQGWNVTALEQRLATYRGGSAWHGDLLGLQGLRWGPEPIGNISETCSEVAQVGSRLSRCNRQSEE